MSKINLGDRVKDKVTGFEGICSGITVWLHGCRRIIIQPEKLGPDGKVIDALSFDEPGVDVVKAGVYLEVIPKTTAKTGGPITKAPTRR